RALAPAPGRAGARARHHPDGARQFQRAQRADPDPAAGLFRRPAGGDGGDQHPAGADRRPAVGQPAAADAAESLRDWGLGIGRSRALVGTASAASFPRIAADRELAAEAAPTRALRESGRKEKRRREPAISLTSIPITS